MKSAEAREAAAKILQDLTTKPPELRGAPLQQLGEIAAALGYRMEWATRVPLGGSPECTRR